MIVTVEVLPRHSVVADVLKLATFGSAFTVTAAVAATGEEIHPLLSVTLTLYMPAPAVVIEVLVGFCVEAVKPPGPDHVKEK